MAGKVTVLRKDIQGLRALAVLAVVFNHAFPDFVTGGYVGVDVFFAISGFLISRIVVREVEEGRFSIGDFYRRRVRRIFPALFVVLLSTIVVGGFVLSPNAFSELARTTASTGVFVSNFDFYKLTGYFDTAAEFKPLLHMWSLAVEEQFYIFFPPLLLFFLPRLGRRRSTFLILFFLLVSLGMAEVIRSYSVSAAYYMLPARAFELLVGAIVGVGELRRPSSAAVRNFLSIVGLLGMLVSITVFTPVTPFPGLYALVPCLGAALVIYSGGDEGLSAAGGALSLKWLVYVGSISYSLYLWHWPVLAFARIVGGAHLTYVWAWTAVFLSFVLAAMSYQYVERPFLGSWGRSFDYLKLGAAQILVVCSLGGGIYLSKGLPQRFSPEAQALFASAQDFNKRRDACHHDGVSLGDINLRNCVFGSQDVEPDTAVWGDSHGAEVVVYLGERAGHERRSVLQLTTSACPPALNFGLAERPRCKGINERYVEWLVANNSIKTVVLVANSDRYSDEQALRSGLQATVSTLADAHKRVVLVKQIPNVSFDVAARVGFLRQYGLLADEMRVTWDEMSVGYEGYDRFIDLLGRDVGAFVYDAKDRLCDSLGCSVYSVVNGVLYFNPDHLSVKGVRVGFGMLADALYAAP